MDEVKKTYREGETGTKEAWRNSDGTDVKDELGNMGDEIRKDLGNAGDEARRQEREEPHPEETKY